MGGQLADNRKISNKRKGRLSERAIFFCYLGVNIMKYDKKKAIDVNVNIKMFKKWKIKMYSFPTFIPQLVPLYRLAFL